MSPETISLLFPDRPIRPLPRRRLLERLSRETADSITYPLATHDSISLFCFPSYNLKDESSTQNVEPASPLQQGRRSEPGRRLLLKGNGSSLMKGIDNEFFIRSTPTPRSPPDILNRVTRHSTRPDQRQGSDANAPLSTTSSVDGYDSFENTNNKKKRKIPIVGDSAVNVIHALTHDGSSLSISAGVQSSLGQVNQGANVQVSAGWTEKNSYATGNQGISGSGRGRLGLPRHGRSPLETLPDTSSSWLWRTRSSPQRLPKGMFPALQIHFSKKPYMSNDKANKLGQILS